MRVSSFIVILISLVNSSPITSQTANQTTRKRPSIGIALKIREGAPSAAAIGCLKAFDELGVPVDMLVADRTAALVGSLYATHHTYEEMTEAYAELTDVYTGENAAAMTYSSDFRIRKFLTRQFGRFDLVTDADFSHLPIPFITKAYDLISGQYIVFVNGSLAEAVRVSLSSPLFMKPVDDGQRQFIGDSDIQSNALRSKGADIVILIVDTLGSDLPKSEQQTLSKLAVGERYQLKANLTGARQDMSLADVVIRVDTSAFDSTSLRDIPELVKIGYGAVMEKREILERFAIPRTELVEHRSTLDSSYRGLLAQADNLTISSIKLQGNKYLDATGVLGEYEVKPGAPFVVDTVVSRLDKLYATGYFRTCWVTFGRNDSGVDLVVHVEESEFLPPEALTRLEASLEAPRAEERRFAAAAIGNLGQKAANAAPQLATLLNDRDRNVRTAAVHSLGELGATAAPVLKSILAVLQSEPDSGVRKAAAWSIARIALSLRSGNDVASVSVLEDALSIIQREQDLIEFQEAISISVKSLKNLQVSDVAEGGGSYTISDPSLQSWLSATDSASLNGNLVHFTLDSGSNQVRFLGGGTKDALRQGLNILSTGKQQALLWVEERKLMMYEKPYKASYAIVVAIDDYDRKHDASHRGPTGYPALSAMVSNARILVETLQKLGFAKDHIITLFDEQATSAAIEAALKSFWPGGPAADADRLFFYFGGHGDKFANVPFLATYDFEKNRPTLTATLMRDLTERHSQNIQAKHVVFVLDACDSGLTLRGLGNPEALDQQMRQFQALSVIRRDTEQPARNILVAGTGEQQALWQNGGVFTRALIDGLNGAADYNQDGIIQFEELGFYVRNRVTAQAAQAAVRQDPDFRVLDQYGSGRVLFVK